jgi:hypothetical protein
LTIKQAFNGLSEIFVKNPNMRQKNWGAFAFQSFATDRTLLQSVSTVDEDGMNDYFRR